MEHGAGGPAWAALLEHSSLGATLRGSLWLYPAVECLHIVGFALLVGSIVSFDVRSLRARSLDAVETLAAQLLPVARTGFALALANIAWFHHRLKAAGETFGIIGLGRLRFSAGLSLGLWICVLLAGRLIAYI